MIVAVADAVTVGSGVKVEVADDVGVRLEVALGDNVGIEVTVALGADVEVRVGVFVGVIGGGTTEVGECVGCLVGTGNAS